MKKQITLRIDEEVLVWFKSKGRGYQGMMNKVLRDFAFGGVLHEMDKPVVESTPSRSVLKRIREQSAAIKYKDPVQGNTTFKPYSKEQQVGKKK